MAFCAKTLRAAGLLTAACVGSALSARCGDARAEPPWPQSKLLAAGPHVIFRQALRSQGPKSEVEGPRPARPRTFDLGLWTLDCGLFEMSRSSYRPVPTAESAPLQIERRLVANWIFASEF